MKMNNKTAKPYLSRVIIVLAVMLVLLAGLAGRVFYLQMVDYKKYQDGAFDQYTTEIPISSKRGTIYDRNMKALAVSATVETVFISPNEILPETRSRIADFLSSTLDVDREFVVERMSKTKTKYQRIKRKVERETADEIRKFINDNDIKGIHLEEDTKRFYPYGSLASHVIGFTNSDNVGIYGIESYYEKYLKGTSGKIITAQDAKGKDMPQQYESYIGAENGTNVVTTIDWQVQSILDKNLETALRDTKAQNRVLGIIMDVKTCEVLAMSTKPDYDLNDPYTLDETSQALYDEYIITPVTDENGLTALPTDEQKNAKFKELLEGLWKNKAITELYEPGSTFKLITSAMALEENIPEVQPGHLFNCTGSKRVGGFTINCHKKSGHGIENFEQGLQNSCNPVFIEIAQSLGRERFYKYFELFGFTERTGIDLAGEASSLYHSDFNGFNETELSVYSFGQTFKITPIQLITAVSAVANGGKLMKPHVVKALVDDDGNTVAEFEPEVVRQVNSQNTTDTIMQYLANGISLGSTKNAYVKGYKIGAKTGTSQKRDKEGNLYIGSCVAFAPTDDPQIAILIAIDEPVGEYYGGTIAAPVVSSVLSEVLPYLGIEPTENDPNAAVNEVSVAEYTGLALTNAKNALHNAGLTARVEGNGDTVLDQFPKYGTKLAEGGVVILYTETSGENADEETVTVPNVSGMSASAAAKTLVNAGLNIKFDGAYREDVSGSVAVKSTPEAGQSVKPGSTVSVEFRHQDNTD